MPDHSVIRALFPITTKVHRPSFLNVIKRWKEDAEYQIDILYGLMIAGIDIRLSDIFYTIDLAKRPRHHFQEEFIADDHLLALEQYFRQFKLRRQQATSFYQMTLIYRQFNKDCRRFHRELEAVKLQAHQPLADEMLLPTSAMV